MKKYLIPTTNGKTIYANSVSCNEGYLTDWDIVTVSFKYGETNFIASIYRETREVADELVVVDEFDNYTLSAHDVLGLFVDLDLLADELVSDILDGTIEEYGDEK